MGAIQLLLLCTLHLLFVQQTNGQAAKIPAMWNMQLATEYPNPMRNDSRCNVSPPMRICDPNEVFSQESREEINNMLKGVEGLMIADSSSAKCLCCKTNPGIVMVVALMKSIGPDVHDFRTEAKFLAEKFHELWNLPSCTVVLVSSMAEKIYYLAPGKAVEALLTSDVILNIDSEVNTTFLAGQLVNGVNQTIMLYSKALNETAKKSEKEASTGFVIPVVIVIIVIASLIVIGVVIIIFKCRKNNAHKKFSEDKAKRNEPSESKEKDTQPLNVL